MKIVQKKMRESDFYYEKYCLNGAYGGAEQTDIGILILYLIITSPDVELCYVYGEGEGEVGEGYSIWRVTKENFDKDLKSLTSNFRDQDLKFWEAKIVYKGEEVIVTGRAKGATLSVRTLTASINMISFLSKIESNTYYYHHYEAELVETIKQHFNMNQKTAVQSIIRLEKYSDIYDEFVAGIYENPFKFPDMDPIVVEGYTAKALHENFPLSELGAYNFLIYLREDHKSAMSDLEKGLPEN